MSADFEVPELSPATQRHVDANNTRKREGVRLSRSRLQRQPTFVKADVDGTIVSKEANDE